MAIPGERDGEYFYKVMGLNKDCSSDQLRTAYKKLALKWHPDRISATKSDEFKDRAKKNFQIINQAYSVISDANKRFLYDLGFYDDNDEEDENGMGDFLGEMATLMKESKPPENKKESFEDLQNMFVDMVQGNKNTTDPFNIPFPPPVPRQTSSSSSSYYASSFMNQETPTEFSFAADGNHSQKFWALDQTFCVGAQDSVGISSSKVKTVRRNGGNQRSTGRGRRGGGIPAV